ncbi:MULTISPECIES: penicillin-binding protein activator LpoB [unclassified Photobacterium]|uniref:penicillin-binding protein activator LpoB n=1 Tax=unclassified Photobacterium TaxID=2628852 RepID=UPI001EE0C5D9|nr:MULTISPECIES: penicillin-binding protein activator LpoB [unclassified Photobacterium]MCG3863640.1 penicillin-binding protein activator LpoB [Photobacterium sp. Ph6]MCG3875169.1 penicillin-binding protein activator LpoB [Photobacterium sp. Ph5]
MKKSVLALLAASSLLGGCAQTVDYVNSHLPDTPSVNFGSNDLDNTASKLTTKMLSSPAVSSITAGGQHPIVIVNNIQNNTSEHVDTASMTNTIKSKISRSGKFNLVAKSRVDAVRKQMNFSENDRFVNQGTAIQFAKMTGAQYMLYGNLTNTNKRQNGQNVPFYKMTMRLMDTNSGSIEWTDSGLAPKSESNSQGW